MLIHSTKFKPLFKRVLRVFNRFVRVNVNVNVLSCCCVNVDVHACDMFKIINHKFRNVERRYF